MKRFEMKFDTLLFSILLITKMVELVFVLKQKLQFLMHVLVGLQVLLAFSLSNKFMRYMQHS